MLGEDLVEDCNGVQRLGVADVRLALVDSLVRLRQRLHRGEAGHGEQLALDVGEDPGGEDLVV